MEDLWIGLIAGGAALVFCVAVVILCLILWRKYRPCCKPTNDDVENQAATSGESGVQNSSTVSGNVNYAFQPIPAHVSLVSPGVVAGQGVRLTILDEKVRALQRTSLATDDRGRFIQLQRLERNSIEQQNIEQVRFEQQRLEQQRLEKLEVHQIHLQQNVRQTNTRLPEYDDEGDDNEDYNDDDIYDDEEGDDEDNDRWQNKKRGRSRERNLNKTRHRSESGDFSRQRIVTDPNKTIDLHYLSVQDAMYKFRQFLGKMENDYHNSNYRRVDRFIHVITGRGLHSKKGIPKIKPEVQKHLDRYNYDNEWKNNGGLVTIDLLSKRRSFK